MKEKIVIIGANDFQNQLILKAKEKGYETHVFAWKEGAVGEKNADFFYPISIIEKEEILNKCEEIQPSGIISIASDLAAITVNYVAEKMNLIGNGIRSSVIATNKYMMRKELVKAGITTLEFYRSDEITDKVVDNMKFPVIVKPVDRSGSRGIAKVENKEELEKAINTAAGLSFEKKAIVEEFIEGKEYSVEYISYKGSHFFLALTQKYTTGSPHFIETGHTQPAIVSEKLLEKIKRVVEHSLDVLLIKNGASHSEIKIDSSGNVKVIEIGGRMGGDCIGSDLVKISTGYDYVDMVIDIACGKKPMFKKICKPQKAEIRFIFSQDDLEKLETIQQNKPERIYRISEINYEGLNEHASIIDSSTRYGYYILSS